MYEKTIEPVAIMHTGFGEKFGIPRQSGLVPEAAGRIIFEPKYRNPDTQLYSNSKHASKTKFSIIPNHYFSLNLL